jgi:hypothetical protein
MASLNRKELESIYRKAKLIFYKSERRGVREQARDIGILVEGVLGQMSALPAEEWEYDL